MKKVLVIGRNGQLASELHERHILYPDYEFLFAGKDILPIENYEEVHRRISNYNPDVIINCSAYTQVDQAESDSENAFLINEKAVQNLANEALKTNALLVHISTDFVFDGTQDIPYKETDPTNPLGIYGKSKLEGEKAIEKSGCDYVIIRTSWLYSVYGHNFVKTMMRLGKDRDSLSVVDDQYGSPTYAGDLADFILTNLAQFEKNKNSIYHFSNTGVTSWYGFASEIMKQANINCDVQPTTTEGYPTPAKRPKYSVMDKSKLKQTFNYSIPEWNQSLKQCIDRLLKS